MRSVQHVFTDTRRRGVILMVVLALLTLFAIIGLSFVLYANSAAESAEIARDAEGGANAVPDAKTNALLNFFLGQILSDADNQSGVYSGMRGHSLGRSVYGYNDTTGINVVPYNGVGRVRGNTNPFGPVVDDTVLINYTYFPGDGFVRDPERQSSRPNPQAAYAPTNAYVGVNAPYTYPDLNSVYLAAVKADGTVLVPSFHRYWTAFGSLDPANPNWFAPNAAPATVPPFPVPPPDPTQKY